MANAIILGSGGGGTSSDELSATGADVRTGKTYVGQDTNDEIGTGIMPEKTAQTYEPKTTVQTIPANQYLTGVQTISAVSQTNLTAANIKTGVTITVKGGNTNIYSVAGTFCNDATLANNNQMLSGNIAYGKNGAKYTGSIVSMAVKTITPTAAKQSVGCASKYMTSDVVVNGDNNFTAANIKKGVRIWGVTGTWEGYVITNENVQVYNRGAINSGWEVVNDHTFQNLTSSRQVDHIAFYRDTPSSYKSFFTIAVSKNQIRFTPGTHTISCTLSTDGLYLSEIGVKTFLSDVKKTPTDLWSGTTSYELNNKGFNSIINNYITIYTGLAQDSTTGSYESIPAKTTSGTYSWPYTVGVLTNKYLYVLIGVSFLYSKNYTNNYLRITNINLTIS